MMGELEEIHTAARKGDVNSVELIISNDPSALNSRDKHSRTPLHLAAWAGHAKVVGALCKHKADVGAAAMDDMGAIHFAAQKGHLEVVKALVASRAPVKAVNRKGMTALHYAVQGSHVELTKYLLKKGADLNAKTKAGKTPLELASSEEIRALLVEFEKAKQEDETGNKEGLEKEGAGPPPEEKAREGGELDGQGEENPKRKGDENYDQESKPKPKKSKVALDHLLTSDDTQEDEVE